MKSLPFAALLLSALLFSACAHAVEKPAFKLVDEGVLYQKVLNDLKDKELAVEFKISAYPPQPDFQFFQTDLNLDGKDEIIVDIYDEMLACNEAGLCKYIIYSRTGEDGLERIAEFHAHPEGIEISDKTTSGVRDLLVYDNPTNEYDYTIYKFNASTGDYEAASGQ